METINILYGFTNVKLYKQFIFSLLSLLKTNKNSIFNIFVITASNKEYVKNSIALTEQQILEIEKYVKSYNLKNKITHIDVSTLVQNKIINKIPKWLHKTHKFLAYYMLRLLSPYIEKINVDKILWIDTDTVIVNELNELYNTDIEDKDVAGVLDSNFFVRLSWMFFKPNDYTPNYINSGILLINLLKVRKEKVFDKVIEWRLRNKTAFNDQSAINHNCSKKIIDKKFNSFSLKKDTVIHHYAGKNKLDLENIQNLRKDFPEYNLLIDDFEVFFKHL